MMTDRICGKCANYRHPATGPMCNKTKKSVGWFQAGCKEWESDTKENESNNQIMENKEQTKVCKECGRELPIEQFAKQVKSRDGHMGVCRECMSAKKSAGVKRQKAAKARYEKTMEIPAIEDKKVKMDDFSDEQLAEELRRRGYAGELKIVRTLTI